MGPMFSDMVPPPTHLGANHGFMINRAAKVVAQSRVRLIVVGVSIGVAIGIQEPRLTYKGIATGTQLNFELRMRKRVSHTHF